MANVMVARVQGNVLVRNIPEDVATGERKGFIVARVDHATLWYYGCYDTDTEAADVAEIIGNGMVVCTKECPYV